MGGGFKYSEERYKSLSADRGYDKKSAGELFVNTKISHKSSADSLNIKARTKNTSGVKDYMLSIGVRECRDTKEHPHTTPIGVITDVTGSMRDTPYKFVKNYFPKLMGKIGQAGIQDPELLFMAVGDHVYDSYPIQIGQFETDTEKILDQLQDFVLEGGGGPNNGESYLLGWIIAGYHTEIDSYYKRGRKGFLFTIGDEPCLPAISGDALKKFLKYQGDPEPITAKEAYEKASEQYNIYHIHITDTGRPFERVRKGWTEIVGQNLLTTTSDKVADLIAETIREHYVPEEDTTTTTENVVENPVEEKPTETDDLML